MRLRFPAGLAAAYCVGSCAGLAACTAATTSGPVNTVTAPSVGRPTPPGSTEAALARMAFAPYSVLGQSDNDALAPGESGTALGNSCVAAAGYPGTTNLLGISIRATGVGLSFGQDWGPWGYLGAADARQVGFRAQPSKALSELGLGGAAKPGKGSNDPSSLPHAEQDALSKCDTIRNNFINDMFNGPLSGITAISADITADVQRDASVKAATRAWSACVKHDGYDYTDPQAMSKAQLSAIYGGNGDQVNAGQAVSPAVNAAQIAAAVTDSNCTQSADLAGIYFAVQASYEQQVVSANQTALTAAVQGFRTAYARELSSLPKLLSTTKATPFNQRPGGRLPPGASLGPGPKSINGGSGVVVGGPATAGG